MSTVSQLFFTCDYDNRSEVNGCHVQTASFSDETIPNAWRRAYKDGWHKRLLVVDNQYKTFHYCPACWEFTRRQGKEVVQKSYKKTCPKCGGKGLYTNRLKKVLADKVKESRKIWQCSVCAKQYVTVLRRAVEVSSI